MFLKLKLMLWIDSSSSTFLISAFTSNTREYANKLAGLLVRLAPGRLEKLYILSEGVGLAVSMSGECLELSRGRVVLGLMATAKLNRKGVQHRSGHS